MTRWRGLPLLLLPLLVLLAAACGSAGADPTPTTVARATAEATQPATEAPPADTPTPEPAAQSVTISAVGDISLARRVVDHMEANGADYPYALIAHLMTGDIGLGNLEGALTDRGDPWPKGYTFRTPSRFAIGLRNAGFDVVSLANNHTMDYGTLGLLDTLAALDEAGVRYIGAGTDAAEAYAPVVVEANGLRVAFLGYADTPTEGGGFAIRDWAAGSHSPGLAIADDAAIAAGVAAAREIADFVIVVGHAGTEYQNTPDAAQRRIVEAALAAGADAYIGHHAHVVQPVEQRGGQLVAWGLGNFIFYLDEVDLAYIPQPRVSLILNLTLTRGQGVTSWEAIPVRLDEKEDRPRPATPDEAAALQQLITP